VLADLSTVVLSVAPLPSGYFKDVHGTVRTLIQSTRQLTWYSGTESSKLLPAVQISVQRQCQGVDAIADKSVRTFKVLENTVKCFTNGGDALRSL
jgi:hypothetical protein